MAEINLAPHPTPTDVLIDEDIMRTYDTRVVYADDEGVVHEATATPLDDKSIILEPCLLVYEWESMSRNARRRLVKTIPLKQVLAIDTEGDDRHVRWVRDGNLTRHLVQSREVEE